MTRGTFQHGLVVGKFYPPHQGHEYLVRSALEHCRKVSVLVLANSLESIPVQARARWLRELFPGASHLRVEAELDDVPIDYDDPEIWRQHVAIMRRVLAAADRREGDATPVDAVFSSEAYGVELARQFDALHVCLDRTRALYPISGTQVRSDPVRHWDALPPPVRAGLALRVVVLGAESTGTTTLARDLCAALRKRGGVWERTRCVSEYGREYSANLLAVLRAQRADGQLAFVEWRESDFLHIAATQTRAEDAAAAHGSPVLVCDTDALATCVWHERYRGRESAALCEFADALPPRALYLLTDHEEVAFEDDGLRDGEHLRPWMTERFMAALSRQRAPWFHLRGDPQQRLAEALAHVDRALATQLRFASADLTSRALAARSSSGS